MTLLCRKGQQNLSKSLNNARVDVNRAFFRDVLCLSCVALRQIKKPYYLKTLSIGIMMLSCGLSVLSWRRYQVKGQ
jgi:hypothetical protein